MVKFNRRYFFLAIVFFIIEILIALFVNDDFIRPYFGDALVVILIYCSVKSFLRISVLKAIILVLAFSFLIEFLQYLGFITVLGLEKSTLAKMILGNSFAWEDIGMYLIGAMLIFMFEKIRISDNQIQGFSKHY